MNKSIAILGGGVYQVPLIKAAKSLGLVVHVVTPNGRFPGIHLGDSHIDLDTRDIASLISFFDANPVNGFATAGTDVAVPSIGALNSRYGFPGISSDSANLCGDKIAMKMAFHKGKVPSPLALFLGDYGDLEESTLDEEYPLVVKPSQSSGSRGVEVLFSKQNVRAAALESAKHDPNGRIIIEKFCRGEEFGMQALVEKKKVVAIFPHTDQMHQIHTNTPVGHVMGSSVDFADPEDLKSLAEKARASVDLNDGILNFDLIQNNEGIHILEIGARLGATGLGELVQYAYNFDIYEYIVKGAIGEDTETSSTHCENIQYVSRMITPSKSGEVLDIDYEEIESLRNEPNVLDIEIDVFQGDYVQEFSSGNHRIGHVIASGESAEAALDLGFSISERVESCIALM
jgi:biotin carboxylase